MRSGTPKVESLLLVRFCQSDRFVQALLEREVYCSAMTARTRLHILNQGNVIHLTSPRIWTNVSHLSLLSIFSTRSLTGALSRIIPPANVSNLLRSHCKEPFTATPRLSSVQCLNGNFPDISLDSIASMVKNPSDAKHLHSFKRWVYLKRDEALVNVVSKFVSGRIKLIDGHLR